jgi:hypothetical protein
MSPDAGGAPAAPAVAVLPASPVTPAMPVLAPDPAVDVAVPLPAAAVVLELPVPACPAAGVPEPAVLCEPLPAAAVVLPDGIVDVAPGLMFAAVGGMPVESSPPLEQAGTVRRRSRA